ncbi:MAG: type III secretion system chaperone [Pseudomonadota bacterium]
MAPETLEIWLSAFGVTQFTGRADFTYRSEIPVSVELTEDGEAIHLVAEVARLPDPDDPAMLRALLMRAHPSAEDVGFALSLDPAGEVVVLWTSWAADALDAEGFSSLFSVFLDATVVVRSVVVAGSSDGPSDQDPGTTPTGPVSIQV